MITPSRLWAALTTKLTQRWTIIACIAGIFASIIGCIASIVGIIAFFWQTEPQPTTAKDHSAFYGRWLSEYKYPNPPAIVSVRAVTEYLENGTYRVAGLQTYSLEEQDQKVVYRIDGAGTWEGNDKWIITLLNDSTDSLQSGQAGTLKLNGAQITKMFGEPQKLTDEIPHGMPERYEVLSIEPDRVKLQMSDLQGNPIIFDMVRTQNRIP